MVETKHYVQNTSIQAFGIESVIVTSKRRRSASQLDDISQIDRLDYGLPIIEITWHVLCLLYPKLIVGLSLIKVRC